ncbi:hypothetical protein HU200_032196 [Digitaria exilis]|uniref:RRM domain-containing protein n=1 Tax=Digitaria exilis TaxID=1010633 RepID=A0A835EPJ2_9POAL|nr:hypothetical protein HU200_032196 [Digitaria exilis]CAB3487328.1 unnamed protein product [Digitaria exilis]
MSISMVCTTCGKKGDHLAIDCPYKDLLQRAYMDHGDPPPAPDRASPPVCPVCRCNPDPGSRCRDDDSSLRVTNLPEAITTERDLYTLLAPFGIVLRVSLSDSEAASSNSPGRGRCGVVEFDQVEDAQEAIGWLSGDDPYYGNLGLRVEWLLPLDPLPPPICAWCLRRSETWICVANLSERAGERDLRNLACPFGIILRLHLAVAEDDGEQAGLGRKVGVVELSRERMLRTPSGGSMGMFLTTWFYELRAH